ncbi:hypothetical protein [Cellulosimicrobium protaetiae]|uniref:HNH endonuclease n=1 Tax=Cellulosimicrobium protaetiae TaxID=2587808 RepID=A0A6M5ULD4_9MICO|nr:hypothetical protein [Cellulosimicrobium protaetiae]QJW37948.1 hypothetical protein FIC82_019005 [Cellulosimicrobium protaetiae]
MAPPLAPAPTADRGRARPSSQTVARVLTRDGTCVFPGCRVPAFRCDLDHVVAPHPGADDDARAAAEVADNLVALCRHHRVVRARDGWRPDLRADGSVRWTAPSGHTYVRPFAARTA